MMLSEIDSTRSRSSLLRLIFGPWRSPVIRTLSASFALRMTLILPLCWPTDSFGIVASLILVVDTHDCNAPVMVDLLFWDRGLTMVVFSTCAVDQKG